MKALRYFLITTATLLGILLLSVSALVLLINPDNYKPQLQQVALENGIILNIAGPLHWSVWPAMGFSASDLTLNLPQSNNTKLETLQIEHISLSLHLLPLLHKNLKISAFELSNVHFFSGTQETLHVEKAHLSVDNANNRGEAFPVKLQLDQTHISGTVSLLSTDTLHVNIDMHGDNLDADRYTLQKASNTTGAANNTVDNPATQANPGLTDNDQPLPIASLLQTQGEYHLHFDQMRIQHLQLSNVTFNARIEANQALLDNFDADLYQGSFKSKAVIALESGQSPQMQLDVSLHDVELAPMLHDTLQEKSSVTAGNINLSSNVHGSGATPKQILRTLSGSAQLDVNDLVIRDLNLEKLACEAAAEAQKKNTPVKSWPAHTILHRLHGESKIDHGIANVNPINARLDTLNLTGAGPVNLISQQLDLKLNVTVLDNVDSANVCEAISPMVRDVAWPMRCEGSYVQSTDKLCRVDKSHMASLIAHIAGKNIKAGGGSIKNAFKKLFD